MLARPADSLLPVSGGSGSGSAPAYATTMLQSALPGASSSAAAPRTVALARKVDAAKSARTSVAEHLCTCLAGLLTLPLLGLPGLRINPPNTRLAVFRFGKLVGQVRAPGLTWFVPCGVFI